jgi:general secretion pathway protein A
MYEPFFGLENSPFGLTPDPRFLFRSKGHHDILATLLYGITTSKGIMVLIGDIGTGKTTLCRALLRDLPEQVESVLILNPHLSPRELVGAILDDLGLGRHDAASKGDMMTALGQHLLAAGREGKTVVVLVDEAQQMSAEALEQIRLLSTLEAPGRKLLQIVLAGQPELEAKLAQPELRQLDQRVAVRCRLGPLSAVETVRYVEHRLRTAGLGGGVPFTRAAITRVYRHSDGVPRVINMVCDRALAAAFASRSRRVDADTVRIAVRNLRGSGRPWPRRPMAIAAVSAVAVIGIAAGATLWTRAGRPMVATPARLWQSVTPAAPAIAAPSAAVPSDASPVTGDRSLLAELIALWTERPVPPAVAAAWPTAEDGTLDVAAVGARYQLAATRLLGPTVDELRAIGLPALLETGPDGRALLLRRVSSEGAALTAENGSEVRWPLDEMSARLRGGAAWLLWRNLDDLPIDASRGLTPAVATAVALRLHKLGHLAMPLPRGREARLQQGVSAFQRSVGLPMDGLMGPRTTLALSRVVAGKLAPTIVEAPR